MVKRRTRPHPFSYCTPRKAVHLVRQAWHGGEAASKSGFPDHFEVRWLNGQILDLEYNSCRIYSTTDIAWVFEAVHSVVDWPRKYISLVIGNTHFQYTCGPCKEEFYLKNLYYTGVLEGTLRMTENHGFLILAIRHALPFDVLPSGLSSRSIGFCDFLGHRWHSRTAFSAMMFKYGKQLVTLVNAGKVIHQGGHKHDSTELGFNSCDSTRHTSTRHDSTNTIQQT